MNAYLIDKIVNKLIELGTIKEDEKELYSYGLLQGLFILLNVVTIVVIGLIFGMLWQSLVFMVTYLPLRSFAGGYHARSQLLCYMYSVILIISVLLTIRFIVWTSFVSIGIALLSGAVIFILSPVGDINKPLDSIEVIVYRRRTRLVLVFQLILIFLFLLLGLDAISSVMSISLLTLSFMLILGKVKNNNIKKVADKPLYE